MKYKYYYLEYFTVDDYFRQKSAENSATTNPYKKLKYPSLPTVNVGSIKKPILIPMELIKVLDGQIRGRISKENPEISQLIIQKVLINDQQLNYNKIHYY